MQRCITWTKKPHKVAKALETSLKHLGLHFKRLITPVKTCFDYLIHSLRSPIKNKVATNYLYALMEKSLKEQGNKILL